MWPDVNPMDSGEIYGIPAEVTDQLPSEAGLFLNAAAIAANAGEVDLDTPEAAAVEMADPSAQSIAAGSPAAPVATSLVALFQTNSSGIRATRSFAFETLRPRRTRP